MPWMAMAEGEYCDTRTEVDVFLVHIIPHTYTTATRKRNRRQSIIAEYIVFIELLGVLCSHDVFIVRFVTHQSLESSQMNSWKFVIFVGGKLLVADFGTDTGVGENFEEKAVR